MNRYFEFSKNQLTLLAILTVIILLLAVGEYVLKFASPNKNNATFQVYIGEEEQKITGTFQLDPNFAPVDSLELLPGVGKVIADRIVEYRKNHSFVAPIDITEVKGIGPKLYERLKPYLKIDK